MAHNDLFNTAKHSPGSVAVIDQTGSYTYEQLCERALRTSAALLQSKGDLLEARVAMLIAPGFDYVATQWGIWQSGGIVAPLGLMHPTPELSYTINDAEVTTVIVHPSLRGRIADVAAAQSLEVLTTEQVASAEPHNGLHTGSVAPNRRAMILYTSGSTGRPKGVVTTHANILAQIDSLVEAWQWRSSDHILHVLPLHHIHGIINVLSCAMRVGAVCEFPPKFDAEKVWQRIAEGGLTLFMAVPTIYAKLIAKWEGASSEERRRWSDGARQMRLMVSGSAALPVQTLERWEQITGQRLLERYGMTEIGMALSNPLDGVRRAGHVGRPLPGVEVRRTNEAGELLDDPTPGEIEVRGANVFLEYWNRPEATARSFRDGWFRTGDVAVVDNGDYRILGRSSVDIIKSGGYKISALEVEDIMRTHPAIRDCAVVGVPDDEWGERVAACIICHANHLLELKSLREWGKQHLAAYKVPTRMFVVEDLPRNAMGKVQKSVVKTMFDKT